MSAAHLKVDNEHIQKSYIEGRCQSHFFSISNHATSIISILPQFLTNPPGSRLFDVGNKIAKNALHSMEWRPFPWNGKATGLDDTFCSITYLKNTLNSLSVGPTRLLSRPQLRCHQILLLSLDFSHLIASSISVPLKGGIASNIRSASESVKWTNSSIEIC